MKKLSVLLVAVCMIFSVSLMAQKPFAGTLKMQVNVEGTDDGNITSQFPMEQQATVFGNKTKVEINQQGIGFTIIQDGDQRTTTSVVDFSVMGMGVYYRIDTVKPATNLKYDYVTDKNDVKTIVGYQCHKVTCTITNLEDDETSEIIYYVSEEFMPDYKSIEAEGLKGYPLAMINQVDNESGKYKVITEVTEITPSKKIKSVNFLLPEKAVPFSEAPAQIKQMFGIE